MLMNTTTKTLTQKVQRLEKRMERMETYVRLSPAMPVEQTHKLSHGLRKLAGLWAKKPRTKRDLTAIRKQLWNE